MTRLLNGLQYVRNAVKNRLATSASFGIEHLVLS